MLVDDSGTANLHGCMDPVRSRESGTLYSAAGAGLCLRSSCRTRRRGSAAADGRGPGRARIITGGVDNAGRCPGVAHLPPCRTCVRQTTNVNNQTRAHAIPTAREWYYRSRRSSREVIQLPVRKWRTCPR